MKPVANNDTIETAPNVLNPQYPSSWWAIGFSDDVRSGEVVPVLALERDLMIWRNADGRLRCQSAICPHLGANIGYGGEIAGDTVRCPFHGYRYDSLGALVERRGEESRAPRRLCLQTYKVQERYGTIFVWNGCDPPDHEIPDLASIFPEYASLQLDEVSCFQYGFFLPFPAKWFIENVPDANHFSALHRVCDWGEPEIIEESRATFRVNLRLKNPKPFLTFDNAREHARLGQLSNPVAASGDLEMTTYGGGIHVVKLAERVDSAGKIGELLKFIDSSRAIACWTPVTAETHVNRYIFLLPGIRIPFFRRVLDPVLNYVLAARAWAAIVQDIAVMRYRREPRNPVYGRLDRGLVRFRRFWDSRILDRSLWAGDNLHSNGLRAGIRWDEVAPVSPATRAEDPREPVPLRDTVQ